MSYMRWSTDTAATGTTCTMRGNMWTSTAAAAAGSPSANLTYVTASACTTSAGQTLCWGQSPPRPYRGPNRFYGYTRERVGCGCHDGRESRINREQRRKREIMKRKANEVSMKLLKSWLSKMEYEYLMEQGQLELPSQYEKDTVYIVKKDTLAKVKIATKKKISCLHKPLVIPTGEACINVGQEYPVGDNLLSKIMLLKSDEKEFLNIANITQYAPTARYAGRFDYIRREPNSGFWFVQLDPEGRCGESYETSTDLNFLHIQHETIPVGDNVHNNIVVPGARQYFIWAREMLQAVQTARNMFAERQRDIERHAEEAEQYVEQEYAGGVTIRMNWSERIHNDALVRYATNTEQEDEQQYYPTTRLGYE